MPNMYSSYGNVPSQVSPAYQDPMDPSAHKRGVMEMCKKYHHYLMMMEGSDGRIYEGIIDGVDDEHVYLLVPVGDMDMEMEGRAFGVPFAGGFFRPRMFRRFFRRRFPFFFFRRFFFPFFF